MRQRRAEKAPEQLQIGDETDNSIDIELAISVAPRFGIAESQAKKEAMEITGTVKDK